MSVVPMTLVLDDGFVRVAVNAVEMGGIHSCDGEEGAGVWSLALWSWESFVFMDALCQVKDLSCKSKNPRPF